MNRIVLIFLFSFTGYVLHAQQFSLMSYNIRYDNPGDNPNHWSGRIDKVVELLKEYNPDLLGIQEALHHQLEDLIAALPHYTYVGVGRDDGKTQGEFSALLFDTQKFELLRTETFWLSENPQIIGSKNWDAAITRIVSWAELRDKQNGKTFFWFNTHFDHIGKEARQHSAKLIRQKIEEIAGKKPVLVSGDFNCEPDDTSYQLMVAKAKPNLFDASAGFKQDCTCCGFEVAQYLNRCVRIDYIFHSKQFKVLNYTTPQNNDGKYYPSDHLPVMARLRLK